MYLLDTNVISEVRKPKPHGAVLAWLRSTPEQQLFLSAVSLGEIQSGIEITRAQNIDKAAEIEAWLEQLARAYQVLPAEAAVFRSYARLMHGRSEQHIEDALIAATALNHGLTVATRNTRDFAPFGVALFNPFLVRRSQQQ